MHDFLRFSWNFIGNNAILRYLENVMVKDRLSHAYVFSGPNHIGKETCVRRFLSLLSCEARTNANEGENQNVPNVPCGECVHCRQIQKGIHPDIFFVQRSFDEKAGKWKKNIAIEQIRAFQDQLALGTFGTRYKIGVIWAAEYLSEEAANSLLKTMEEARPRVIIFLTTESENELLPTIVSRCHVLHFQPVSERVLYDGLVSQMNVDRTQALLFSRLSGGLPGKAVYFSQEKKAFKQYQQQVQEFVEIFQENIAGRLMRVNRMISGAHQGNDVSERLSETVSVWIDVLRDILILKTSPEPLPLLKNEWHVEPLMQVAKRYTPLELLKLLKSLRQLPQKFHQNLQPRMVIDQFFLSF
jgi:DNA polymerase-3 subunit delta'